MGGDYTFPFDTCEKPRESGIAQPYSVAVNVVSCFIVLYFLVRTKSNHAFLLLLALLIFESFHTLSHLIHIKGTFSYTATHISGFLFNVAFLNFLYRYTKVFPRPYYFGIFCVILACDLYAFLHLSFIFAVLTQILLFITILSYYYPLLNKDIKANLNIILGFFFLIYLAFVNEKMNCKSMMKSFPDFPFHMIIEALGILPIYILCNTVYGL